ncbi:MAG TPA: hypothetical protein VHZ03_36310 [Trebonia sp.]|nr:hypothetical protein [Trebonia sp.]
MTVTVAVAVAVTVTVTVARPEAVVTPAPAVRFVRDLVAQMGQNGEEIDRFAYKANRCD